MKASPRPWIITALATLLALETLAILTLGSFHAFELIPQPTWHIRLIANSWQPLLTFALAALTTIATIGLLRLWRTAWLFAMLVQGIVLFVLLRASLLGIASQNDYLVMGLAIFIVLYLNYSERQVWPQGATEGEEPHL